MMFTNTSSTVSTYVYIILCVSCKESTHVNIQGVDAGMICKCILSLLYSRCMAPGMFMTACIQHTNYAVVSQFY